MRFMDPEVGQRHQSSIAWQITLFALHLGILYLSVEFCSPWIAGRIHDWLLPLFHQELESRLQFMFNHILVLSSVPAFIAGLINSRQRHMASVFVWIVPAMVLGYELLTFRSSILQSHFPAAFQYFFSGGFNIPEHRDFSDLFSIAASNPDMIRGVEQWRFTAPFYGGIAYSLAQLDPTRFRFGFIKRCRRGVSSPIST